MRPLYEDYMTLRGSCPGDRPISLPDVLALVQLRAITDSSYVNDLLDVVIALDAAWFEVSKKLKAKESTTSGNTTPSDRRQRSPSGR